MAGSKIDIRDLRDGKFLWIDKAALELVSAKAGNRGVTVYSWLCYYANARGQDCFPSLNRLARHCGVSSRTVARTIKRLAVIGAIAIEHVVGRGNVYRLLDVPVLAQTPDSHVRRPVTPVSGVPLTPMSPEQELIEQELYNKTTATQDLPVDNLTAEERNALTVLMLELKDRIDLVRFTRWYAGKHGVSPSGEVMLQACRQFKVEAGEVRNVWAWFERVIRAAYAQHHASREVKTHAQIKREPVRLGDVMTAIARHAP